MTSEIQKQSSARRFCEIFCILKLEFNELSYKQPPPKKTPQLTHSLTKARAADGRRETEQDINHQKLKIICRCHTFSSVIYSLCHISTMWTSLKFLPQNPPKILFLKVKVNNWRAIVWPNKEKTYTMSDT